MQRVSEVVPETGQSGHMETEDMVRHWTFVGFEIGSEPPGWADLPRAYKVPAPASSPFSNAARGSACSWREIAVISC
jgi:hypothetical protein